MKKLAFVLFTFALLTFVSAKTIPVVNIYPTGNVNNSNYWDGYDSYLDLPNWSQVYNHTAVIEGLGLSNTDGLRDLGCTDGQLPINRSGIWDCIDNSTLAGSGSSSGAYNISYHTWLLNETAYSKFWYNMTGASATTYWNVSGVNLYPSNIDYNVSFGKKSSNSKFGFYYTGEGNGDYGKVLGITGYSPSIALNDLSGSQPNLSISWNQGILRIGEYRNSTDMNESLKVWNNKVYSDSFCLNADTCITTWPSVSGGSFNATYATWLGNYTASNKFWYNMTINTGSYNSTYATWLGNYTASNKFWYNQTSSYTKWFYNMTTPAINYVNNNYGTYNYNMTINTGSYNSTYATWLNNYTNYYPFWLNHTQVILNLGLSYNMTTPAINYVDNNFAKNSGDDLTGNYTVAGNLSIGGSNIFWNGTCLITTSTTTREELC